MKKYFTARNVFIVLVALLAFKLVLAAMDYAVCGHLTGEFYSEKGLEDSCFRRNFGL